jgi:hypothetical protein
MKSSLLVAEHSHGSLKIHEAKERPPTLSGRPFLSARIN